MRVDASTYELKRFMPRTGPRRRVAYAGRMSPVSRVYDWFGDGRLLVADLGLACCTLEFEAAALDRPEVAPGERPTAPLAVVVSGTVPDALVPVVREAVDVLGREVGRTPLVVAYGACASSGGPYWDSYAVADGISQFLPVAAYVPGCPPPAGSLEDTLAGLARAGSGKADS